MKEAAIAQLPHVKHYGPKDHFLNEIFPKLLTYLKSDNIKDDKDCTSLILALFEASDKDIKIEEYQEDLINYWKDVLDWSDWRKRSKLLDEFIGFAKCLGKEIFTNLFLDLIKESLSDRIFIVRKNTVELIYKITDIFGIEWFFKCVLDYLYAFKSDQNYLHRQTSLFCLIELSHKLWK